MRLSDIKGEKALDVLADILEPLAEIAQDKEFTSNLGKDTGKAIKHVLKEHKKAIITMLAIINEEDVETYEPSLLTLPALLLDIFNDPEVIRLFQSQVQITESTSSGLATENTKVEKI